MKRTHAFAFALAIGVIVTLTLGTGSFTTTDAARDVTIGTSDDAYLGVDAASPSVDAGNTSTVELLTLSNDFETELGTVSVTTAHSNVTAIDHADSIGAGGSEAVNASVTCGSESFAVDFDVTAEGDGVSVETTETVTVTCAA